MREGGKGKRMRRRYEKVWIRVERNGVRRGKKKKGKRRRQGENSKKRC